MHKRYVSSFFMVGLVTAAAAEACVADDSTPSSSFDASVTGLDAASDHTTPSVDGSTADTSMTDGAPLVDAGADALSDADAGAEAPLLLASGIQSTLDLALHGTNLFWIEGVQFQENKIRMCSTSGCGTPTTVATEPAVTYLRYVTADDASVYYTTQDSNGSGRVMRADIASDGGAGTLLSNEAPQQPWMIDIGPSGLYWLDYYNGDLVHCDPANCVATRKAIGNGGPRADGLKLSPTSAYWVGEGNPASQSFAATCSLPECDGGSSTLMFPGQNARQLRLGGGYFYFLNFNPLNTKYEVKACPTAGCPDAGTAPTISSDDIAPSAQTLTANSTNVYWLHANNVVSCPTGGCDGGAANLHTAIPAGQTPNLLVSDESHVYYLTAEGELWRVPK